MPLFPHSTIYLFYAAVLDHPYILYRNPPVLTLTPKAYDIVPHATPTWYDQLLLTALTNLLGDDAPTLPTTIWEIGRAAFLVIHHTGEKVKELRAEVARLSEEVKKLEKEKTELEKEVKEWEKEAHGAKEDVKWWERLGAVLEKDWGISLKRFTRALGDDIVRVGDVEEWGNGGLCGDRED